MSICYNKIWQYFGCQVSNCYKKHALKNIYLFRDGIQLVHDQTVRYMNKGLYPDEITRKVHLPPYLAEHPFLQEFYGTVEWSIKAVFANYMGWFSGKVFFFFISYLTSFIFFLVIPAA